MGAVYSQLSVQERRKIESWWHAKVPVREMARVLKRHKSTIFREIKRTARARTSSEKRFPGFPLFMAYLPSFLLSDKPGLVQFYLAVVRHMLVSPHDLG